MYFILGVITGILISVINIITLIFFKKIIQNKIDIIDRAITNIFPKQKGFIVEPMGTIEEERENIINKNKQEGRDTPITDLI